MPGPVANNKFLSDEVLQSIFKYLNGETLIRTALVSRQFAQVSRKELARRAEDKTNTEFEYLLYLPHLSSFTQNLLLTLKSGKYLAKIRLLLIFHTYQNTKTIPDEDYRFIEFVLNQNNLAAFALPTLYLLADNDELRNKWFVQLAGLRTAYPEEVAVGLTLLFSHLTSESQKNISLDLLCSSSSEDANTLKGLATIPNGLPLQRKKQLVELCLGKSYTTLILLAFYEDRLNINLSLLSDNMFVEIISKLYFLTTSIDFRYLICRRLLNLLNHPDNIVRVDAIRSIAAIFPYLSDKVHISSLLLQDSYHHENVIRMAAAQALCEMYAFLNEGFQQKAFTRMMEVLVDEQKDSLEKIKALSKLQKYAISVAQKDQCNKRIDGFYRENFADCAGSGEDNVASLFVEMLAERVAYNSNVFTNLAASMIASGERFARIVAIKTLVALYLWFKKNNWRHRQSQCFEILSRDDLLEHAEKELIKLYRYLNTEHRQIIFDRFLAQLKFRFFDKNYNFLSKLQTSLVAKKIIEKVTTSNAYDLFIRVEFLIPHLTFDDNIAVFNKLHQFVLKNPGYQEIFVNVYANTYDQVKDISHQAVLFSMADSIFSKSLNYVPALLRTSYIRAIGRVNQAKLFDRLKNHMKSEQDSEQLHSARAMAAVFPQLYKDNQIIANHCLAQFFSVNVPAASDAVNDISRIWPEFDQATPKPILFNLNAQRKRANRMDEMCAGSESNVPRRVASM